MTVNGSKQLGVNYDFSSGGKIVNLTAATTSGEAVEYDQLNTQLATKQDGLVMGSGVEIDSNVLALNLSESGTDYSQVTISGADFSSLNGVYTRANANGYLEYSGLELDFTYNSGDFAFFYKDNGGGTYALLAKRDVDGTYDSFDASGSGGTWLAVLTNTNPATITANVNALIPNYQAVDYDFITYSHALDENSNYVPNESDSNVAYESGVGSSYLKFINGELLADVVTDLANAETGKLASSDAVKTYIDEQDTTSRTAASNTFINSTASLTGSPNNVQSAIESVAAEIDVIDGQIVTLQATDVTHTSRLDNQDLLLVVDDFETAWTAWSAPGSSFIGAGNLTMKPAIQQLGDSVDGIYVNLGLMLGIPSGATDFGTGFIILSNNASAKTLFQEIETELQNLSQGIGQFWSPVDAHSDTNIDISNPATDTFEGAVVTSGQRVLLKGQTDQSENGIYVWTGSSSPMNRAIDADASSEFTVNKTVQVLRSTVEGISGATFAYTGSSNPTLGTDNLTFVLKAQGVIGDNTITEEKVAQAVLDDINDKCDIYSETVTLAAGVSQQITHGLNSQDVIVRCYDNSGNETKLEVDITDSSYVIVNSLYAGDFKIVVLG